MSDTRIRWDPPTEEEEKAAQAMWPKISVFGDSYPIPADRPALVHRGYWKLCQEQPREAEKLRRRMLGLEPLPPTEESEDEAANDPASTPPAPAAARAPSPPQRRHQPPRAPSPPRASMLAPPSQPSPPPQMHSPAPVPVPMPYPQPSQLFLPQQIPSHQFVQQQPQPQFAVQQPVAVPVQYPVQPFAQLAPARIAVQVPARLALQPLTPQQVNTPPNAMGVIFADSSASMSPAMNGGESGFVQYPAQNMSSLSGSNVPSYVQPYSQEMGIFHRQQDNVYRGAVGPQPPYPNRVELYQQPPTAQSRMEMYVNNVQYGYQQQNPGVVSSSPGLYYSGQRTSMSAAASYQDGNGLQHVAMAGFHQNREIVHREPYPESYQELPRQSFQEPYSRDYYREPQRESYHRQQTYRESISRNVETNGNATPMSWNPLGNARPRGKKDRRHRNRNRGNNNGQQHQQQHQQQQDGRRSRNRNQRSNRAPAASGPPAAVAGPSHQRSPAPPAVQGGNRGDRRRQFQASSSGEEDPEYNFFAVLNNNNNASGQSTRPASFGGTPESGSQLNYATNQPRPLRSQLSASSPPFVSRIYPPDPPATSNVISGITQPSTEQQSANSARSALLAAIANPRPQQRRPTVESSTQVSMSSSNDTPLPVAAAAAATGTGTGTGTGNRRRRRRNQNNRGYHQWRANNDMNLVSYSIEERLSRAAAQQMTISSPEEQASGANTPAESLNEHEEEVTESSYMFNYGMLFSSRRSRN